MRINCPYCGERGIDEFSYLGDASVVRPDPASPDAADAFYAYAYERRNVRRGDAGALVSRSRDATLGSSFHATRAPMKSPTSNWLRTLLSNARKSRARRHDRNRRRHFETQWAWIDRSLEAARFHFRRRSLYGLCRRYAGFGSARQRRAPGRPFVQVSPSARHSDLRLGGAECACRASFGSAPRAQYQGNRCRALLRPRSEKPKSLSVALARPSRHQRTSVAGLVGRVLLQDIHVAGLVLGKSLRADDPARCGPWPGRDRRRSRHL